MNAMQADTLRELLRRADEVRGLSERLEGGEPAQAPGPDELLRTLAELVQELERSHRRLIETNVQLVSLREVASGTVNAADGAETTRLVTRYLCRAFGFEEGFLLLADRDTGRLEGTWTHRQDGAEESHALSLPLLGDHGALTRGFWLNRSLLHQAPGPQGTALVPDGHPLADVLAQIGSVACVPLQRSDQVLPAAEVHELCGARCIVGDARLIAPPPGEAADGWAEDREERQRQCLTCALMPVLGVIGMARRRNAGPLTGGDLTQLESIALSVAPLVENARLNQQLRRSERFRDHVLDSISSALIAVNMQGEVLTFNRHAEEMLGWSEAEVLGRQVGGLCGSDVEALLHEALEHGREARRVETTLRNREGGALPVRMNTTLLRNERLSIYGAIATFIDLTPLRRAEEHAARLDRLAALGRFTSSVAHEIRNPLTGIGTGIQYLTRSLGPDSAQRENLDFILGEIKRLDRIVQDLFDVTHPRKLQVRTAPIEDTLQRAIQCLQAIIEAQGLDVAVTVAPRTPPVPHDADQLEQVFINLVKNAVEASARGSRVALTVTATGPAVFSPVASADETDGPGPGVVVRVQDQGCGIDADALRTVFEPFFTTKPGGTGLGLYISHDIVKRHGGSLTVASEPGRGTTFTVALPFDHNGGKS